MGGKKKTSLKKIEQMQKRKTQEKGKKKKKEVKEKKKKKAIVELDFKNGTFIKEIDKIKVLTPYNVATQLNLRISSAKNLLKQLESNGTIKLVSGNHRLKIYKTIQ